MWILTRFCKVGSDPVADIELVLQDAPMNPISVLCAAVALLLPSPGMSEPGEAPSPPVEQRGRCRGSGIGEALLSAANAQALPIPECNLAVWIGDASVSFFRAGDATPLILFSGQSGTRGGFDVELIGIGSESVRDVSSGRCMRMGRYAIMCHAVFEEDGVRRGVALTFELPAGTELSRSRRAPTR
jgi:hypothetical protein